MIEKITTYLKGSIPAVVSALALFFGYLISTVYKQKQRNTIDAIDNKIEKTSLDIGSKPIDDLVSESNKSHGASEVVEPPGIDRKKG